MIWDHPFLNEILRFFTCCGLLELWGMRNLELTTPKGTTVPNHSLRLPRIELHNPKVWSQNCLFQKYKTRDWLNNILWCNTQCYFSCSQIKMSHNLIANSFNSWIFKFNSESIRFIFAFSSISPTIGSTYGAGIKPTRHESTGRPSNQFSSIRFSIISSAP